jgi:hypothetical protein
MSICAFGARFVVASTLVAGGCLYAGCDSGPQSTTETTPPQIIWNVLDQEKNENQQYPATATVTAGPQDHFLVTLKAVDNGGIQRISLSGGGSWRCDGGGSVVQDRNVLYKPDSVTLHPDASGQVEHSAFRVYTVSPNGWVCQEGFQFAHGQVTLDGSASNYSNRQASGALTITRPH